MNSSMHMSFKCTLIIVRIISLEWRHNGRDGDQITNLTIVYPTVYSDADKKNIIAPRRRFLHGEFTGDR